MFLRDFYAIINHFLGTVIPVDIVPIRYRIGYKFKESRRSAAVDIFIRIGHRVKAGDEYVLERRIDILYRMDGLHQMLVSGGIVRYARIILDGVQVETKCDSLHSPSECILYLTTSLAGYFRAAYGDSIRDTCGGCRQCIHLPFNDKYILSLMTDIEKGGLAVKPSVGYVLGLFAAFDSPEQKALQNASALIWDGKDMGLADHRLAVIVIDLAYSIQILLAIVLLPCDVGNYLLPCRNESELEIVNPLRSEISHILEVAAGLRSLRAVVVIEIPDEV